MSDPKAKALHKFTTTSSRRHHTRTSKFQSFRPDSTHSFLSHCKNGMVVLLPPQDCHLTRAQLDRLVGLGMLVTASVVFLYYTIWTLLMVGPLQLRVLGTKANALLSHLSTGITLSKMSSLLESGPFASPSYLSSWARLLLDPS